MKITNIYRCKTTNVGDMYSSPCLYFDWLKKCEKVDIYMDNVKEKIKKPGDRVLVLGGGGLIANKDFSESLDWLVNSKFLLKIAWGIGHNTHDGKEDFPLDPILASFDLVGLRDYNSKYEWVPCASCLHKAFDIKYKVKHEIVVYEHKNFPLEINSHPKTNNKSSNLRNVLEFLGSGEIILTNTYHGAYWGTLLRRKVVVIDPFSNKFANFKHKPVISTLSAFSRDLNKAQTFPNSLEESRQANILFSNKVKKMINELL